MKKIGLILLAGGLLFSCANESKQSSEIKIIPQPVRIEKQDGHFSLTRNIQINTAADSELGKIRDYLVEEVRLFTGMEILKKASLSSSGRINLFISKTPAYRPEGYFLEVKPDEINIQAGDYPGIFYGVISLVQLLPLQPAGSKIPDQIQIPCLKIKDYPRFKWRGMMLDVCRHYFSPEFVKGLIDNLARHKLNTFHWHLTEDQGWRIEIKKYPKLSQISAYRDETLAGHYRDLPRKFDGKRHGGFFTQAQVKEIVRYAKERYITVVPEIEMPGHSSAALAAYPELACRKGPFKVQTLWGVFDDVYCAGKESTFQFITDVLTEVVDIFPSPYVHIGGDECPKIRWETCPFCQKRIKDEKLKDEHELQSYFIKRIEKFLHSKGKRLIGWDEILEGGLAPEATVMSWRGEKGGIEAAKSGHDVVMSPTSNCYFDYYQGNPDYEPLAIGGYIPLKTVYSYDPLPAELNPEEQKHVLGAQANLWTEYISSAGQAEYMIFPRISALAEVVWTLRTEKDWGQFTRRLKKQLKRYQRLGLNYASSIYQVDIDTEIIKNENSLFLILKNQVQDGVIRFTDNAQNPDETSMVYRKKIKISRSGEIRAVTFLNGRQAGGVTHRRIYLHKGIGKTIRTRIRMNPDWGKKGINQLLDGIRGGINLDDLWVGIEGADFEAELNLGKKIPLERISARFMSYPARNILAPALVTICVSEDGADYKIIQEKKLVPNFDLEGRHIESFNLPCDQQAKYVKIMARNAGLFPEGHFKAGQKTWLFLDEIEIY